MTTDAKRGGPIIRGAFDGPRPRATGERPFVFDIIGPDGVTSILPEDLRLVLYAPPQSVGINYAKLIVPINTEGGVVEQHFGEGLKSLSFSSVTGGFVRLYTGLSNITGGGTDTGGNRRETLAHEMFLDLLALFYNNGKVYDLSGKVVFNGRIKVTFDDGVYFGWMSELSITESTAKPYMFDLTFGFTVEEEVLNLRSLPYLPPSSVRPSSSPANTLDPVLDNIAFDLLQSPR